MRACVASGGSGTRMLPVTSLINKHLIPVDENHLMIDYPMMQIKNLGFKEVIVVTGSCHAGQIVDYIQDGNKYGFECVHYAFQPKPAGIADVLKRISHLSFNQKEGILLILGDNYFSENFPVLNPDKNYKHALAFEYDIGSKEEAMRFGQVYRTPEKTTIVEKPKKPIGSKILTGLYYFPCDVFTRVEKLSPSKRGELEITDLLKMYLEDDRLGIAECNGKWSDLGEMKSWMKFVSEKYGGEK